MELVSHMHGLQWRCCFLHTIQSLRMHALLFSTDFLLTTPTEISFQGFPFFRDVIHLASEALFFRT